VSRGYSVNGLNQYTAAGTASFGYDANGNLSSDGSTTFTYDVENRLVAASGARNANLRYDPLGRLYEVSGSSGTTRFLYDGDALVAEYNATGSLTARYVHGNTAADDPLVWYDNGQRRYLRTDHQGSVIAMTNDSGTATTINAYDEWGIPDTANLGRFQYTGQAWIPELGMYHYKARVYSPTLGRFLQADPVGYQGGMNLYAYVGNDPFNLTDSTGLATDEDVRAARQTLNSLKAAIRAEINQADEPAAGSRIRANSDTARIAVLQTMLSRLEGLDPEVVADMRVNAPAASVGQGLTGAMRGYERVYSAIPSEDGGVRYERASQSSSNEDSGRGNSAPNALADAHRHRPGEGRGYPGIGDPGNVLTRGVAQIYAEGSNSNAIGWNGTRFTLTNMQGSMPSWGSAPQWVRDTFAPW
jgi:RHS repeat-associated protein